MFLQTIFLVAIGVYGVQGQFILYYHGCLNKIEYNPCIPDNNEFNFLNVSTIIDFLFTPSQEMCSKKTKVFPILECVYDKVLECYSKQRHHDFLPSKLNVKAFDYHCSHINTYNATCLRRSVRTLVGCVVAGVWGDRIKVPQNNESILEYPPISNYTYDDVKSYICGSQRNGKTICTKYSYYFDGCPENRELFLNINKFQNPEACGGEAGYESEDFGLSGSTETPEENTATSMCQSVVLVTIALLMFIY